MFSSGTVTAAGVLILAFSFLGLLIRQIGPWNRQVQQVEAQLRNDLMRRVTRLEAKLDRERAIHKAEISLDRHRLNNVSACFDALLLLIEMAPEKAAESVIKIKQMRSAQMDAEATEKAAIRAAEITALAEIEADLEGEEDTDAQPQG